MFNRKELEKIQKERMDLGERKSHDYGAVADGIAICGVEGIATRLVDKILRAKSLTQPNFKAQVTDEALRDTFLDIGNYADYAVSLLDGTWGKESGPLVVGLTDEEINAFSQHFDEVLRRSRETAMNGKMEEVQSGPMTIDELRDDINQQMLEKIGVPQGVVDHAKRIMQDFPDYKKIPERIQKIANALHPPVIPETKTHWVIACDYHDGFGKVYLSSTRTYNSFLYGIQNAHKFTTIESAKNHLIDMPPTMHNHSNFRIIPVTE